MIEHDASGSNFESHAYHLKAMAKRLFFNEMDNAGFIEFSTDWDALSNSAKERFINIVFAVLSEWPQE